MCQKYPVTKNENVEFLIQEIDRIINNSQNIIESKSVRLAEKINLIILDLKQYMLVLNRF